MCDVREKDERVRKTPISTFVTNGALTILIAIVVVFGIYERTSQMENYYLEWLAALLLPVLAAIVGAASAYYYGSVKR